MKKLLCTLLCVMLVLTMMPGVALADGMGNPPPDNLYYGNPNQVGNITFVTTNECTEVHKPDGQNGTVQMTRNDLQSPGWKTELRGAADNGTPGYLVYVQDDIVYALQQSGAESTNKEVVKIEWETDNGRWNFLFQNAGSCGIGATVDGTYYELSVVVGDDGQGGNGDNTGDSENGGGDQNDPEPLVMLASPMGDALKPDGSMAQFNEVQYNGVLKSGQATEIYFYGRNKDGKIIELPAEGVTFAEQYLENGNTSASPGKEFSYSKNEDGKKMLLYTRAKATSDKVGSNRQFYELAVTYDGVTYHGIAVNTEGGNGSGGNATEQLYWFDKGMVKSVADNGALTINQQSETTPDLCVPFSEVTIEMGKSILGYYAVFNDGVYQMVRPTGIQGGGIRSQTEDATGLYRLTGQSIGDNYGIIRDDSANGGPILKLPVSVTMPKTGFFKERVYEADHLIGNTFEYNEFVQQGATSASFYVISQTDSYDAAGALSARLGRPGNGAFVEATADRDGLSMKKLPQVKNSPLAIWEITVADEYTNDGGSWVVEFKSGDGAFGNARDVTIYDKGHLQQGNLAITTQAVTLSGDSMQQFDGKICDEVSLENGESLTMYFYGQYNGQLIEIPAENVTINAVYQNSNMDKTVPEGEFTYIVENGVKKLKYVRSDATATILNGAAEQWYRIKSVAYNGIEYGYGNSSGGCHVNTYVEDQNPDAGRYILRTEQLTDPTEFTMNLTGQNIPTNRLNVSGQGETLIFNDKITKWYTSFFVWDYNTGRDVHYSGTGEEVRRYYGTKAEDFELQVSEDGLTWKAVDEVTGVNHPFSFNYIGQKKNFQRVFEVKYDPSYAAAAETYKYRLKYVADNPYLQVSTAGEGDYIRLSVETGFPEFEIDEYWYDEDGNCWATGNVLYPDRVGKTIYTEVHIRPGVLRAVEDKVLYNKNDFIEIENKVSDLTFYYWDPQQNKEVAFTNAQDMPFTVEWVPNEGTAYMGRTGYYKITYTNPEKDLYGPHYTMRYTGNDYNSLINNKYEFGADTIHEVGNASDIITGKITVHVNDEIDGTIDATTEQETHGAEIIFGDTAVDNVNDDETVGIKTNDAELTIGGGLISRIKIHNGKVHLKMWNIKDDVNYLDLKAEGQDISNQKIEAAKCGKAFDFKFDYDNNEAIEFGDDGFITIRIPWENEEAGICYIKENGERQYLDCTFERVDGKGYLVFTAKHFSVYAIDDDPPEGSGAGEGSGEGTDPGTPDEGTTPGGGNTGGDTPGGNTGGSIGGGGAYVPSTPSTPAAPEKPAAGEVVTDTADNSVSAGAAVTDTTGNTVEAAVDQATADKAVEAAVSSKAEEVVFDATSKNTSAASSVKESAVELPTTAMAQIAEKTEADVTIKTDVAEVTLDQAAAAAIAEAAVAQDSETVTVVVEKVKAEAKSVRYEVTFVTAGGQTIDLDETGATVTVKLPEDLKKQEKLVCVHIDEKGHMTKVEGWKNADGTFTWKTGKK